jgi:hypothetical protein
VGFTALPGLTTYTDTISSGSVADWVLQDLGPVRLPPTFGLSPSESGKVFLTLSGYGAETVDVYELVILPLDEWAGDFQSAQNVLGSTLPQGYRSDTTYSNYLDLDSIGYPKVALQALSRFAATGYVQDVYAPLTNSPVILQAAAHQRLWFAASNINSYNSDPWTACSVRLFHQNRYKSMRGDR